MRLSYLIPDGQYPFFRQAVPHLERLGLTVYVNRVEADTDVILAGILPVTHGWMDYLEQERRPVVMWHWDLYTFTDYREDRWARFLRLLPRAAQVWSCTYDVARQLKEELGIDSLVVPAWVDPDELNAGAARWHKNYALYAASGCGFGKRIEWAERACALEDIPLKVLRGQELPRGQYVELLQNCRCYVMTAFEESNATIPAMEAAACGKPVVLADLPASKEVFGPTAHYFPANDFGGLRRALRDAWNGGEALPALGRTRILSRYSVAAVAELMAKYLRWCYREHY